MSELQMREDTRFMEGRTIAEIYPESTSHLVIVTDDGEKLMIEAEMTPRSQGPGVAILSVERL